MAKLPGYMKAGPLIKDENGHYGYSLIINLRHPLFLWDVIKNLFVNYKWWRPRFWYCLFVIVITWIVNWFRGWPDIKTGNRNG
jgi:hypothetical protein